MEDFSRLLRLWLPVVFWVALMVGISTEAGSLASSDSLLRPILLWFNPDLAPGQLYTANVAFRKLCHLTEFAVLAILLFRTRDLLTTPLPTHGFLRQAALPLGVSALLAVGTEAFQLTTTRRSASPWDVLINILGACLGLVVVFLCKKWFARRRERPLRILVATGVDLTRAEDTTVLETLWETVAATRPAALVLSDPPGPATDAAALLELLAETARPARVFLCAADGPWNQAAAGAAISVLSQPGQDWEILTLTCASDTLAIAVRGTPRFLISFSSHPPVPPPPGPILHLPRTAGLRFLLVDPQSGTSFGPFAAGQFQE